MKTAWWKYVLGEIAFWVLVLVGDIVVMIWNTLSASLLGTDAMDITYLLVHIGSTAIGAALAICALDAITDGNHKLLCVINCVIAATLFAVLTILNIVLGSAGTSDIIAMVLAIAVLIIGAVVMGRKMEYPSKNQ